MLTSNLDPQLQIERVLAINEALYDKWRRRPPKSQPIDTLVFADTAPLTPDEETHIRAVVAGVAAGLDADADALSDVLDALGILPPKPANVANLHAKRQYGQCRHCWRASIPLRKNGLLVGHSRREKQPVSEARCDGGGTRPVKQKRAAA
ncbi:hypothetical protein ACBJ59_10925 [Nonomuraea sp. MTCD27]|uniref:hypothetical protein n=1 Tax=Nonomuraea sp. MTCD27 TaxID=1676747 RepID=UPI0035BF2C7E